MEQFIADNPLLERDEGRDENGAEVSDAGEIAINGHDEPREPPQQQDGAGGNDDSATDLNLVNDWSSYGRNGSDEDDD
ncbi:hypothetical protein Q8G81_35205, partial [Klebsiella pneumoniae]